MTSSLAIPAAAPTTAPAPASTPTALDRVGFELGWDYAHYRVTPPAPYAQEASPLRDGLHAGTAAFGLRTLRATRHLRQWLQLRLHAWLRGRSVETFQVTPNYLAQIDAEHCPITRVVLSMAPGGASIDRVRNDAGYAAGNLAVMSARANHAKGGHGHAEALQFARRAEYSATGEVGGLSAAQWARVAALCSYLEPMPHAQACAEPMRVLPPNRLRLFNPVQALQALLSRQLLHTGWSHRLSRIEDLLPGKALKHDFKLFFMALLPRVLEAGPTSDTQTLRWALEDAWGNPLVLQRWTAFARQFDAAQCEALVHKLAARKLAGTVVQKLRGAQATEGWQTETRGYVPHDAPRQAELAWC